MYDKNAGMPAIIGFTDYDPVEDTESQVAGIAVTESVMFH